MKRIWIALALIVAVGAVCICEHMLSVNMSNSLTEEIVKAKEEIYNENYENALRITDDISNSWYDYQKSLSVFLSHDILQKTDSSITAVRSGLETGDYSDALKEAELFKNQLREIKETEEISAENIL